MGFQFVHLECYSRVGARRKNGGHKPSIADIHAELIRMPHACPHVASPKAPTILAGMTPAEAIDVINLRAGNAVDAIGRVLRPQALVLVSGVASWPVPRLVVESDAREREKYVKWRNHTVSWVCNRYPNCDVMCVEHCDEPYFHIHFWIMPRIGCDGGLRIGDAHEGHRAAAEAAKESKSRREQGEAYRAAMRRFQDDYYNEVGARHGLTRLGPRRQRLTRAEWQEQKSQAQAFAEAQCRLDRQAREAAKAEGRQIYEELRAQNRQKLAGLAHKYAQKDALIAAQAAELARLRAILHENGLGAGNSYRA